MAVVYGLAVAWIADPSLDETRLLLSVVYALLALLAQLLFRRFAPNVLDDPSIWPVWVRATSIVFVNFFVVLLVARNLAGQWLPMAFVVGTTLGLAMLAYWFSQRPDSEASARHAAVSIYTACLALPFAGLYNWLPAAAIWASVAAVPAWHARRIAMADTAETGASRELMTAAIFIYVLIMLTGLMLAALLPLR
jgi:hypothetical protein